MPERVGMVRRNCYRRKRTCTFDQDLMLVKQSNAKHNQSREDIDKFIFPSPAEESIFGLTVNIEIFLTAEAPNCNAHKQPLATAPSIGLHMFPSDSRCNFHRSGG